MQLLTYNSAKIAKSNKSGSGWLTAIMYLAPARLSGKNVCPWSTPGCRAACLNTAGRGMMGTVQAARLARTRFFFEHRPAFRVQLEKEIAAHERKARKLGRKPAVRLNGTSDIRWEKVMPGLFASFPDVQFYDYTKSLDRMQRQAECELPLNYDLTFSGSNEGSMGYRDNGWPIALRALGANVTLVFRGALPKTFAGVPVVDGDETDERFLDAALGNQGVIIGLTAKGRAKHDRSGFVLDVTP